MLEAMNLTVGSISEVEDDAEKGTVIFQSTAPGTSIPEHTKINLNVSSGPTETPPPEDETPGEGTEGEEGGTEEGLPPEENGAPEENGGQEGENGGDA